VFRFISLGDAPKQLKILVDDLVEVLKVTDVSKILDRFYEEGKGNDPIIHFYETFLAKYDPSVRERRGVYYTPEPVVHYITKSLHHLLKTKFNKSDGFASEGVTVLDPAGGTLTFPSEAIRLAVDEYTEKYGTGGRKSFIKNHILKNFYAFELMMAPYSIGHLKIGFILDELGYQMAENERFPLYLTNTLEMEELDQISIPGLGSLSEESHLAGQVKKNQPILVVMGNPPYSIEAGTLTKEARELVQRYKFIDGEKIKEKGALQFEKNLQDDYVKFIAFAQQKIEKSDHGVVGIITNHSFLESPTLRGMRWQLMDSFDEIYILDLHGSSKKKESAPDGGKDENVFDIQQGVSISFLIKNEESNKKAKVYKADLFGLRDSKYDFLESHTIASTKFKRIYPNVGFYFFKDYDQKLEKSFHKFPSLKDIFPVNGAGIITAHDGFAIEDDAKALSNRFNRFKAARSDEDELHDSFQVKKKKGWSIVKAWEAFQKLTGSDIEEKIIPITHRPFDQKHIMYEDHIVWSMSNPTMQHMRNENLGLMAPRQFKEESGALVTEYVMAHKTVSAYDTNFMFPLYLYPTKEKKKSRGDQMLMFMEPESEYVTKRPNISTEIFDMLEKAYGKKPSPENIFYYIYAVLYSPTYREKYAEFLKIDFPRVPFAKDKKLFLDLAVLGERLADLHLLKSSELDPPIARYMGEGDDDVIVKPEFVQDIIASEAKQFPNSKNEIASPAARNDGNQVGTSGNDGKVTINATKYFEGVPEEVWNYHIGGYQVLHKYLKDRKGRKMDDPRHYCRIVTSLARTIELQKEIDVLFEAVEKSAIDWKI